MTREANELTLNDRPWGRVPRRLQYATIPVENESKLISVLRVVQALRGPKGLRCDPLNVSEALSRDDSSQLTLVE